MCAGFFVLDVPNVLAVEENSGFSAVHVRIRHGCRFKVLHLYFLKVLWCIWIITVKIQDHGWDNLAFYSSVGQNEFHTFNVLKCSAFSFLFCSSVPTCCEIIQQLSTNAVINTQSNVPIGWKTSSRVKLYFDLSFRTNFIISLTQKDHFIEPHFMP